MFKTVEQDVWAFDAEWVPDPNAGRALYRLPAEMDDSEVVLEMWQRNGATDEDPTPFLKVAMCRVVSIAMVMRHRRGDGRIELDLRSQPSDPRSAKSCEEASIISRFLESIGRRGPQLVGFNSKQSDLPILIQRGTINGISAPRFCERPNKPWEGRDYFAQGGSNWNIDLMRTVGGWGRSRPSLNEIAILSGIPGKMDDFDGGSVAETWLNGDIARIVRYNEHDAVTTYLVWLRLAHFGGHLTAEKYEREQQQMRELLERRAQEKKNEHLARYVREWDRLHGRAADPPPSAETNGAPALPEDQDPGPSDASE